MPTARRATALLAACACLAACATAPTPQRESQKDPAANLAAYRSFAWRPAVDEGTADQPLRMLDVNIRNAIVAELTGRGYVEGDASPQFLVTYDTALKDKVKSNPFRVGIGLGSFGGNVGGSVNVGSPSVKSFQEGALTIHIIDAAANREVWYGSVSGEVGKAAPDAATVARAVGIAMQDFPRRAE